VEAIAGWVFTALGLFVLFAVYPGRPGGIVFPGLLPIFGLPFALMFLACQYGVALYLRSRRGMFLVTAVLIAGMALGGCGHAMDLWGELAEHNIPALRYVVGAGACASGVALGIALLRGWVRDER